MLVLYPALVYFMPVFIVHSRPMNSLELSHSLVAEYTHDIMHPFIPPPLPNPYEVTTGNADARSPHTTQSSRHTELTSHVEPMTCV
jgi:hypothetical protein